MGVSEALAQFVSQIQYEQLPVGALRQFRRSLLDYAAACVAGCRTDVVEKVLASTPHDVRGPSSIVGCAGGFPASLAAFVNGTSAHSLEMDDGHREGSCHPAGVIFPSVLAVAEAEGCKAKDVIVSVIAGYEVMCRLSAAIHPIARKRGFHNTAITGVFGSACAVARLLGLSAHQTQNALGLAGSYAGGLFEFLATGAEVKRLHPGKAAHDGVICAKLAKAGVTGPDEVLEGKDGFFHAFAAGEANIGRLLRGLGEEFEIERTYFKPYPCCRHLHSPIDAILEIRKEITGAGLHLDDLARLETIEIGTYEVAAAHQGRTCTSLLERQMSLPYAALVALLYGHVGLNEMMSVPCPSVIRSGMDKVRVYVDPEIEKAYPQSRIARVTVRFARRAYHATVRAPLGGPERPLSDSELQRKFELAAGGVFSKDQCQRIVRQIATFRSARTLMRSLRQSPGAKGGVEE